MRIPGILLCAVVATASWLTPVTTCPARAADHPVRARLLANVAAVAPERTFLLGVELRMEEGWHTYWRFGGDAGLPTTVEWNLPPGFRAGPLLWPAPTKFSEAGDLTGYGYADQVLLLAEVAVPAGLPVGSPLTFGVTVTWLACRQSCIPGNATLDLVLPVVTGEPTSANADLFARYRAQVPAPLGADVNLDWAVYRSGGEVRIDLVVAGAEHPLEVTADAPDFYPIPDGSPEFGPQQRLGAHGRELEREGAHPGPVRLRLRLRPYENEAIRTLGGVLVYRLVGQEGPRHVAVELDLEARQGQAPAGLLDMDFRLSGADSGTRSLGLYLLLAAVGGLILNLMPCVLPVISLKVLGFVSQAGAERGRVRQLGLVFAAGIVVAFLSLAVVVVLLKAGGEQLGWGFQFQYPGFVMAMAALVFALGLSLFGVFELRLPGLQGAVGVVGEGEGTWGSFANGVLATILATPCTAPFLGTALGFAFSRSSAVVLAVFLCIGGGMAAPYVLLALQPGWMRLLPKPGAWMERFKQAMGFLLMATVLWLLWVLGKQVGVEGLVWTGAFLLCLALACWILGQWADLRRGRRQRLAGWAAAVVVVVVAYAVFLSPVLETDQALAAAPPSADGELPWVPFSVERVEGLMAEGRNIFIDFTAEWCWTCKVNERTVLADPLVRQKFVDTEMVPIKADWTSRSPDITALLQAFGRSGVPLYVILPGGRPDEPIILPELITAGLVVRKLEEAAALQRRQR